MPKAERWTAIHLASLPALLVVLIAFARNQWFFDDEWDSLTRRGLNHPVGLFAPHNENWTTIPLLIYRGLFAVFGLRTYWPYLLALFALHLLVVHMLWRVMRSADVPIAFATAAAVAFGLFGRGSENILFAIQIAYLAPLAAGIALMFAIRPDPEPKRVTAVTVCAALVLPWSAFSVQMVAMVGLVALARWGWRRAAIVTFPSAAIYIAWFTWQGHKSLDGGLRKYHGGPGDIPRYVFGGIGATLGAPLHNVRVGEALFVIVVAVTAVNLRRWWRDYPQVLALAVGAPIWFATISQGRGEFPDPGLSRYVYMAAAMLLPLVTLVAWRLSRQRAAAVPVLTAAAVLVALGGAKQLRHDGFLQTEIKQGLRRQLIAAVHLKEAGVGVISNNPDYMWDQGLRIEPLVRLVHRGQLPTVPVAPYDVARARLGMQLRVSSPHASTVLTGVTASRPAGVRFVDEPGGCVSARFKSHAELKVRIDTPGSFSIETPGTGELDIWVPLDNDVIAGPRPVTLTANDATVITTTIPALTLWMPAGAVRLCGITWS